MSAHSCAALSTPEAIEATIRTLLARVGQSGSSLASLSSDADLYAAGLSSLATIDLMMALEEQFAVEFSDRMLNRRTFGSIARIAAAVIECRGGV